MKQRGNLAGLAEAAAAVFLTLGASFMFRACTVHDGTFMVCHWAQNAVVLIGAVLVILSLLRLIIRGQEIRTGLALSISVVSAATILIPGRIVHLCMMETMQCQAVFRPAVIIVSALLAVIAGADGITGLLRFGKKT